MALRENDLYPGLPPVANYAIAAVYIGCALAVAYYMHTEYYALGTERAGDWNSTDLFMGGLMTVLVLEYSRKRHMPLFVLNIILMLYAVYGYVVPGMFYHAGLELEPRRHRDERRDDDRRVLQPAADRAHGGRRLPARAERAERLRLHRIAAARDQAGGGRVRPHALPQSAVIGSMAVGTISGSGAANAITIGSATIPAMIGAGMPPRDRGGDRSRRPRSAAS